MVEQAENNLARLNQALRPPSLSEAEESGLVTLGEGYSIIIHPKKEWTVEGEGQIASTTQIRFFEWAREAFQRHLNEIVPNFDTRTRASKEEFKDEVEPQSAIHVKLVRANPSATSFTLGFELVQDGTVKSKHETVQVCVQQAGGGNIGKIQIPEPIKKYLENLNLPDENDLNSPTTP